MNLRIVLHELNHENKLSLFLAVSNQLKYPNLDTLFEETFNIDHDYFQNLLRIAEIFNTEIVIIQNHEEPITLGIETTDTRVRQLYLYFNSINDCFYSVRSSENTYDDNPTNFYSIRNEIEQENRDIPTNMTNFYSNFMSAMLREYNQNFNFVEVVKDRLSFFRALANQLSDDENEYRNLRDNVADFIEINEELYINFVDQNRYINLREYVNHMILSNDWDEDLILDAFSRSLNINIIIIHNFNDFNHLPHIFVPRTIYLYRNNNNIFFSLRFNQNNQDEN